MASAAVFLDRDGVINADRTDFVKSWTEFVFLPNALDGLRTLAALPLKIVVATNQSGIGRGLLTEGCLQKMHKNLLGEVSRYGGRIDAIYHCPHLPEDRCDCRKPKPGLLMTAARGMNIDLHSSWMVGDSLRDVDAARAAGVIPILIRSPRSADVADSSRDGGLLLVDDLRQAAVIIERALS